MFQVYWPYPSSIEVVNTLVERDMSRQISNVRYILDMLHGVYEKVPRYPVLEMYRNQIKWLESHLACLTCKPSFREYNSSVSDFYCPDWLTEDLCDYYKRKLYTLSPTDYPQFADYGTIDENWYVIDGKLVKYRKGEKI